MRMAQGAATPSHNPDVSFGSRPSCFELPMTIKLWRAGAVLALAACGGGNPSGGPPPATTLAVTSAVATPASVLQGDTVRISGSGTASDRSTPTVTISYLGSTVATGNGSVQATLVPTGGGGGQVVVSKTGVTSAAQGFTIGYTPLTASGVPSLNSVPVGQSIGYTLTGPTGTDSLDAAASDGRRFVVVGSSGTVQVPVILAGSLTLMPAAYNATAKVTGTPTTVTGIAMGTLRILVTEVTGMPLVRTNVTVGAETINVPADTTITRPQGTYALGIGGTQVEAYVYGEMTVNGAWRPLASNLLTHRVTLGAVNTATITLISRGQPNFSGTAMTSAGVWVGDDGKYHPALPGDWSVVFIENPTGALLQGCRAMDANDLAQALTSISQMQVEDEAGPDGRRRTYTYLPGDPLQTGKLVANPNGTYRPAPRTRVGCKTVAGGQSNAKFYDAQGFLEATLDRASGDFAGWTSEQKGGTDMSYGTKESPNQDSRHWVGGGVVRTAIDSFVYNHPMRIAFRAGKEGYGLLNAPVP